MCTLSPVDFIISNANGRADAWLKSHPVSVLVSLLSLAYACLSYHFHCLLSLCIVAFSVLSLNCTRLVYVPFSSQPCLGCVSVSILSLTCPFCIVSFSVLSPYLSALSLSCQFLRLLSALFLNSVVPVFLCISLACHCVCRVNPNVDFYMLDNLSLTICAIL